MFVSTHNGSDLLKIILHGLFLPFKHIVSPNKQILFEWQLTQFHQFTTQPI